MLDTLFDLANVVAIVGWLSLLASPFAPRAADWIGGTLAPLALALGYTACLVGFALFGTGEAPQGVSFTTLDGVAALLSTREALLAGWVHYLAFDLFVGAWEVREGRRLFLPFAAVAPCLLLTFVSGPLGLLVFLLLRAAMRRRLLLHEPGRASAGASG